jgi:predicted CXXCH cytochrome family protein
MPASSGASSKTPAKSRGKHKTAPRFVIPRLLKLLLAGVGVAVVLTISGFTFAATQEQHDPFCASCHTLPESTFYQRSLAVQPVDMASAHKAEGTRCIDCHSGSGVTGRLQAELLGAHNALAFITHTAAQPAVLSYPIRDINCLKCHSDLGAKQEMSNHFHIFLPRWQAMDPTAATCVSCHNAHTTDGSAQIVFLNQQRTLAVCMACHKALGGGE